MSLQGLNVTMDVIRRTETRDAVGGSVYAGSTIASSIRCRLGDASMGIKMSLQEQGYATTRIHQIVAQPSNLNVKENDLVLMHGGQYDGQQFIVRLVKKDSLPASDSRSHVELGVERVIEARTTP